MSGAKFPANGYNRLTRPLISDGRQSVSSPCRVPSRLQQWHRMFLCGQPIYRAVWYHAGWRSGNPLNIKAFFQVSYFYNGNSHSNETASYKEPPVALRWQPAWFWLHYTYRHAPLERHIYLHYEMRLEMTFPFPNFNGCSVEIWDWIITFTPTRYLTCHYLSMLGLKLRHAAKTGHRKARLVWKWQTTFW